MLYKLQIWDYIQIAVETVHKYIQNVFPKGYRSKLKVLSETKTCERLLNVAKEIAFAFSIRCFWIKSIKVKATLLSSNHPVRKVNHHAITPKVFSQMYAFGNSLTLNVHKRLFFHPSFVLFWCVGGTLNNICATHS